MFQCGRFKLSLNQPLIMGIVNVTPDSFSDGGQFQCLDEILTYVETLVRDGVDILDIGGESTRPNAASVSVSEEIDRIMPVLQSIREFNIPISLDTRRTEVMFAALSEGLIDMVNDIQALEDKGAVQLLAKSNAAVCLMHMKGIPSNMQVQPEYKNVVDEVCTYLESRVKSCLEAGLHRNQLIVDVGFGFGKTFRHNMTLFQCLPEMVKRTALPMLVGLSRKTMLGKITGESQPANRKGASVAAAMEAVRRGASIVRVHDVKETRQALQVMRALSVSSII